uniref:Uncharacterized protein n=1 Tax=Candidatus Kentrum sp. TUN TaxID=2126343 RepID=A0A451A0R7_9GAMM|nr:MAG: hypothetical protein BECKTUN1418F_GA0071002_105414 [Candidatus Kentron sp. TUN]VFK59618.1 MAG: hypothetical protein BECKTUN1418E_GA0071001_105414 [Candidatus Kentron sp. TUN]
MKRLILLALSILMLGGNLAFAGDHIGKIDLYHLNSDVHNRGVCIRMIPGLPGTGWACLWKNNGLYTEITDMLLEGFSTSRNCTITWHGNDSHGHLLINIAECR